MDPHKASQAPKDKTDEGDEAPEWRGGSRPEQEQRQRSGERGWGAANAGGQHGSDVDNQETGRRGEKGDDSRHGRTREEGFDPSEKSEPGEDRSNR